jgi:hypothetical protein
MELVEIIFNYCGALIEVQIYPENNFRGFIYRVEINGKYAFRLAFTDDDEWMILQGSNVKAPQVGSELSRMILKQLKWELNHVV